MVAVAGQQEGFVFITRCEIEVRGQMHHGEPLVAVGQIHELLARELAVHVALAAEHTQRLLVARIAYHVQQLALDCRQGLELGLGLAHTQRHR